MRYLRDAESIPYPGIRDLVRQRITELTDLSQGEPFDPNLISLILVEPGDTPASLEAGCDCLITTSLLIDAKNPDFMPCFEWIEHHAHCYEIVFIMTDDGCGTVLFVPDEPDIDPELLAFCREYATSVIEAN